MNEEHKYNLDEGIIEYFDFSIRGKSYRFRQPNAAEIELLRESKDEENSKSVLFSLIESIGDSPTFEETYKTMTIPYLKAFNNMISKEMSLDANL